MNPKRHRTPGRPAAPILSVLALLFALVPGVAAAPESIDAVDPSPSARQKMHGGLEELVTGKWSLDPRFADLVPGYAAGEIPFFAVLSVAPDAARRSTLRSLGVRILRQYRTVDAFALVGRPGAVTRVAGLSWVRWMTPVEVVVALDDEEVGPQNRATTGDVGAPAWWGLGITGAGVRIAVLDTGLDYTMPEQTGVAGVGHPDFDDLDFRHWSEVVPGAPKVVQMRDFNGGGCRPFAGDGHGHGTHVAGIATGTGEGDPTSPDGDGMYTGIAPDAELAVGKVLTDAGAGLNSDLLGAMEWAAMPEGSAPCAIGAHIVNLSLGSESRPNRINTGHDVDMVSLVLNGLATRYGTLFVVAAGNSGPFNGSVLETPGHASQALSVAATAKDYDLNHDDTLSGDACAGYQHPNEDDSPDNDCTEGVGTQRSSISSFSSRGPSAGMWQKPDIAAPGYNIVSAQSSTGAALLANDLNVGTRDDLLYATATGTSMASPATAGSAALLLQAYLEEHGTMPTGSAGMGTRRVRAHALLKAALMNSANSSLYESRWILNFAAGTEDDLANCPDVVPFGLCTIVDIFADFATGANTLYEVRNRAADPFVGPWAGGAGKLQLSGAINALRSGVVMYSALMSTATFFDPGHRDFQGVWNVGPVPAGAGRTQRFVLHAAPEVGPVAATFRFVGRRPSDGSSAIPFGAAPDAWGITLPGTTTIPRGGDVTVSMRVDIPTSAGAGMYTGAVLASLSNGQTIRIPVSAFVPLHDPNGADGNAPGPQARIASAADVFAKGDTTWPSLVGLSGTGANADWLVYRANLGAGLAEARFSVYDATAAGDETYDLYLYDTDFNLIKTTHPFTSEGSGVTDQTANDARGPTPQSDPQELTLPAPSRGRYFLVVNRAKVGGTSTGDFGQFVLTLDEVAATP